MLVSRLRGRPFPALASLYPTHRCNLRCTYCSSPYLNTPELETAAWLTVVDELAELGCRRVAILGGEPLLRTDIPEIIDRVKDRGMSCVLTSNGTLAARLMGRLLRLDTLVLSLDAAGAANDEVRGRGVFDAVQEAVKAARDAGVPVKINTVLSAKTAPLLDELLAFVERHDLHVTLNVMRSGAPELWREAASIKADDKDIRHVLVRIARLVGENPRVLFSEETYRYAAGWGDYSKDRFEAGELPASDPRLRDGPPCQAGRYFFTINPDGTTHPCALTAGRISGGNVVRDGVAAAWRGLHDHSCVACYSPCLVEQNHLFSLKPAVVWHFLGRHLGRFS